MRLKYPVVHLRLFLFLSAVAGFLPACNNPRKVPASVRHLLFGYEHVDAKTYLYQQFLAQGPSGWMVEFRDKIGDITTYVFCPDGYCNMTEFAEEYQGTWQLEADTIRLQFDEKIKAVFVGKKNPVPVNQELGSRKEPEYAEYYEQSSGVMLNRSLCWSELVSNVLEDDPYPYRMISRSADCRH